LNFDRYCDEIVTQSSLLSAGLPGAHLATPVPSCPGWTVGQLVRHLGGGQRWCAEIVRTRATAPPSDAPFRDLSGYDDKDPDALGGWLVDGAAELADALRDAGPDASMWTPVPGQTPAWLARRFTHETVIHRADALLALGAQFEVDADVAVDGVDEWMALGSLPQLLDVHPRWRELLAPGRTIHLHAVDAPEAEWVVDLTGDVIAWRRAHEKAAVAVRGPLTDLLLIVYRRRPARAAGVEIFGDEQLLDFWLERIAFG
jgi:uncharacterized protein (TIGR03083 family)